MNNTYKQAHISNDKQSINMWKVRASDTKRLIHKTVANEQIIIPAGNSIREKVFLVAH